MVIKKKMVRFFLISFILTIKSAYNENFFATFLINSKKIIYSLFKIKYFKKVAQGGERKFLCEREGISAATLSKWLRTGKAFKSQQLIGY